MCNYCDYMIKEQPKVGGIDSFGGMELVRTWRDYTLLYCDDETDYNGFAKVALRLRKFYFPNAVNLVAECVTDDMIGWPHIIKCYWDGESFYTDVDEGALEKADADNIMDALELRLY